MLKYFSKKVDTTEADARAMEESRAILQARIERLMSAGRRNVFEVELEGPAGGGTVSMAVLAAKVEAMRGMRNAA